MIQLEEEKEETLFAINNVRLPVKAIKPSNLSVKKRKKKKKNWLSHPVLDVRIAPGSHWETSVPQILASLITPIPLYSGQKPPEDYRQAVLRVTFLGAHNAAATLGGIYLFIYLFNLSVHSLKQ